MNISISNKEEYFGWVINEMRTSLNKFKVLEQKFGKITQEYEEGVYGHRVGQTRQDLRQLAAKDPRRKVVASQAEWHRDRAAMLASVIQAELAIESRLDHIKQTSSSIIRIQRTGA